MKTLTTDFGIEIKIRRLNMNSAHGFTEGADVPEYCRECQHPHVNERLRKEVAELRKELALLKQGIILPGGGEMFAEQKLIERQAETIKRMTTALADIATRTRVGIIKKIAKSALSGTKETE